MKLVKLNEKIRINPANVVYIVDETKPAIALPGSNSPVGDGTPRTKIIFVSGLYVDLLMEVEKVSDLIEGNSVDGSRS